MPKYPPWRLLAGLTMLGGVFFLLPPEWLGVSRAETPNFTPASRPSSRASKATSRPHQAKQDKNFPKESAVCQTGCAASGHGGHQSDFSHKKYLHFLQEYAQQPPTAEHIALETLLFYGPQTRTWLKKEKGSLPLAHHLFLRSQLQQRHAYVSLRIVDRKGVRRVWMAPKRIVLGEHFHLHADETTRIQAPSFGGRVERVGLYHLWTRI
ncbi:MAG: hypothetical protein H6727_06240 [Myxococcales bacterium]|nr:hypothetical protein [Myxococcales bacterium]